MIFLELFLTFFRIGLFTFGGGYAMLPLVQEAVLNKKWMSNEDIVDFIAVSESTPGPFAINIATYVGNETGGTFGGILGGILGGIIATLGVVLPSFIVILIVAKCFEKFRASKAVKGCMSGLKPAVIGMIGSAVVSIGTTVFFPNGLTFAVLSGISFYISLAIFAVALILVLVKKVNPIIIIGMSAIVGIVSGFALNL